MALEHCSSSVNAKVTELMKNMVTPRFTDRQRSGAHMLVKTPTDSHNDDSHRLSGHSTLLLVWVFENTSILIACQVLTLVLVNAQLACCKLSNRHIIIVEMLEVELLQMLFIVLSQQC